jgi:ring-1,2-phenylacetyl-CoA epoxidase subunit PaaC
VALHRRDVHLRRGGRGDGRARHRAAVAGAARRAEIFEEATLTVPPLDTYMQRGGKQGRHSERLGYILAEMQFLQRAYPGVEW